MTVLDLLGLLIVWVVIGFVVAITVGRASELGREPDKDDETIARPTADAALETPRPRRNNRKRVAGSRNKNVAQADRGGIKAKKRKCAA